jgi:hypothetical protein
MALGSNKPSRYQRIVARFRNLNAKEAGWYGDSESFSEESWIYIIQKRLLLTRWTKERLRVDGEGGGSFKY